MNPTLFSFCKSCIVFVLLCSINMVYAARLVILHHGDMYISQKRSTQLLEDKGYSIRSIQKQKFKELGQFPKKLKTKTTYWAKYEFRAKEAGNYYFYFGKAEFISVFVSKNGGKFQQKEIGDFTPRSQLDVPVRPRSAMIHFHKGEKATVYTRFFNETNYSPRISLSVQEGEDFQKDAMLGRLGWQALFQGALWMMILYNLFLWFSVWDKAYLYYAAYMIVIALTFILHERIHYQLPTSFAEYPRIMFFAEIVFSQISVMLYFLFMHKMVDTQRLIPFWHKVTQLWILIKLVILPFAIWYNIYKLPDNQSIMYILMAIDFVLLLVTCLLLMFKEDRVARYFAVGSIILALCGLASILNWQGITNIRELEKLVQLGTIVQIIIFSMGLGFKTRRNASLVFELQKQNEELVSQLRSKVNEQEKTLRLFMRYVPEPVVAKALNKTGEDSYFDGENRYVTALFCDVRGFTTISEELKPREVVAFLNDFYSVMTVVIKKYGGSVNQFIGDEIFAVFGAPLSTSNNEQRAVLAALEMIEKIQYLNDKYQPEFRRPIYVGIGINAGEVVAGNLGSEEKIGYSVVGDTVNTAKRVEGLTKSTPNSVIISENVYRKVAPIIQVEVLEEVMLKGKRNSLRAYRVLGKKG